MTSVLIVDDSEVMRAAVRSLLELEPGIRVVGEAEDGKAAVPLALELRPDIVLADISMPGPSGIDIAAVLSIHQPTTRVLVLSNYEDMDLVRSALSAGAAGYVCKRMAVSQLVPSIRQILEGRTGIVAVTQN